MRHGDEQTLTHPPRACFKLRGARMACGLAWLGLARAPPLCLAACPETEVSRAGGGSALRRARLAAMPCDAVLEIGAEQGPRNETHRPRTPVCPGCEAVCSPVQS